MKRWQIIFLVFLIVATAMILTKNTPYHTDEGRIFGTSYRITYKHKENLHEDIKNILQQVDNSLSPFNKNSTISKINNNEGNEPDSMFLYIFGMAQEVSEETSGAFDITVAPLVNAWGFGFKQGITPDSLTIDSLRNFTGYKKISIANGKVVKQHPETMLNCSAIAKGYGCDAVAHMLHCKGIEDYMVEIGGEVVLKGRNKKNVPWVIGINKPSEDGRNELQTVLQLTDCCMATSGNYRNFRFVDGKKVSHTINPQTGYPANNSLLSATVITDECAYADALATAFMVMGKDKAMEYCNNNPKIEAYFIYADEKGNMQTVSTEGFNKYIKR
ncbi:MAG: FAD:protein FMN transferase [Bacteroidales bacterium]|nr:FAD:protein FMN transferase [Bacteroidales bacterium]